MPAVGNTRPQRFESALKDHTTYSQYAGDVDTSVISRTAIAFGTVGQGAKTKAKLTWKDFKTPKYEAKGDDRREVERLCLLNYRKHVNLANYMIEEPQICHSTDKLRKVCDLFRHMQLRQLAVVNPIDGRLVGVITRQDIFAYMSI